MPSGEQSKVVATTAASSNSASEQSSEAGAQGQDGQVAPGTPGAPQQPQPTRMESFMALAKSLIIRALIIYFISSFFRKPVAPQNDPQKNPAATGPRVSAWNFFENGTYFDLHVYLSESYDHADFENPESLIWFQPGLVYGDWSSGADGDGTYVHHKQIKASENLMRNGSIYLHAFVTKMGRSPNPKAGDNYAGQMMGHAQRMLNKYKKLRANRNYNLLSGGPTPSEEVAAAAQKDIIVSHWHPNLTINLVTDQTNWVRGSIPQPLDEYVEFVHDGRTYLPIVFLNDYWNMAREYMPINETTPVLDLTLTFQPLSLFKWQLYAAQAMKHKWTSNIFGELMSGGGGEETDEDQDSLKETLLETNPYLLGLTIAVSILHSVFELLAFKNDIQFWNNRKSLEGLSVRSVFFGVFQSLIVLLYVLDNETNFMIRISCFVGLGIEVWKIQKVVDIKTDSSRKFLGIFPRLEFKDKGSYVDSSTRQYDNLAFKYLGWVCFPLLVGYSVYSLIYNEHKGWYSFILNILYGYLLTFGFIMMTPQLFINYKLKSVAHLPWRMMTYKFLNTFIDDIFAFVIKMPTMYRLGCFRDDIVFFIFLYQRWIYKVDHKRVNEFGFSGEMEEEAKKRVVVAANSNHVPVGEDAAAVADSAPAAEPKKSPAAKKKD